MTSQRSSIASHNVDMCNFIKQNKRFLDITQCMRLSKEDASALIPRSMKQNIYDEGTVDVDQIVDESLSDDESDGDEE